MSENPEQSEDESRKDFFQSGARFFQFNGGRNTPNILIQLGERIEKLEVVARETGVAVTKLDAGVREASESSAKLATALNRLTFAYIIVTGVGVMVAIAALILQLLR